MKSAIDVIANVQRVRERVFTAGSSFLSSE
jgi:hypothetical protein